MPEDNNCPKPECGKPESSSRYKAGRKLSICGNAHSWDAVEIAEQRAKAREAEFQEHKLEYRQPTIDEIREGFRERYGLR
jgi:hypothetical protein